VDHHEQLRLEVGDRVVGVVAQEVRLRHHEEELLERIEHLLDREPVPVAHELAQERVLADPVQAQHDRGGHDVAEREPVDVDLAGAGPEVAADALAEPLHHRGDQRLLVREVLVERPDADAGLVRDVIGGRAVEPAGRDRRRGGVEQVLDRLAGALLMGSAAAHHGTRVVCE
jgi:hypothetical protein